MLSWYTAIQWLLLLHSRLLVRLFKWWITPIPSPESTDKPISAASGIDKAIPVPQSVSSSDSIALPFAECDASELDDVRSTPRVSTSPPSSPLPVTSANGHGRVPYYTFHRRLLDDTVCMIERNLLRVNSGMNSAEGTPVSPSNASTGNSSATSAITCQVCFLGANQPTATTCGHLFCHNCIIGEVSKHLRCPICQTVVFVRLQTNRD